MNASDKLRQVLTELLMFEVTSKSKLNNWYDRSGEVHQLVKSEKLELPEIVWHYLSDADIRLKDPEYAIHQIEGVRKFIAS